MVYLIFSKTNPMMPLPPSPEQICYILSCIIQALTGALTPNFRRISYVIDWMTVTIRFNLRESIQSDLDEIIDVLFELEALLGGRAQGRPRLGIPQSRLSRFRQNVCARGDHAGAVRAEACAPHGALMLAGRTHRLPRVRIPYLRGFVLARGDNVSAVRAKARSIHAEQM